MKILLSNAVVSHGAFHHWMTADMRALGHQVSTIDPDELCEQFGIELYRRVLLQRIAADKPDMLLLYPPYDLLREQENRIIHKSGTVIVGFAYDDPIFLPSYLSTPTSFQTICAEFKKTYDIYLTTSRQMVKEAKDRGIDGIMHIRWACNTPPDPGTATRDIPVLVIGAPYPRRVNMVKHLKNAGIKPVIFGAEGWKHFLDVADCYNGMLTRPGMFEMYRRARIALAPADWESTYTPMIKLRSLEIASMGPLQICEECLDLADYYDNGKDVVSYSTWNELVEKIRYYIAPEHEEERARIARAGWERTVKDHVWQVRFSEIEKRVKPLLEKLRRGEEIRLESNSADADDTPSKDKYAGGAADDASPSSVTCAGNAAPAPDPCDPHLAQELGLSACGGHYEKLGDLNTALIAYDEWLVLQPNCFTALVAKGRALLAAKNHPEAEKHLLQSLQNKDLCGMGVDITCTQRKLGPRMGLGRLFNGIFPRYLEVYSHLLLTYAQQDRSDKIEELMSRIVHIQDHLFVAIVALIAEPGIETQLPAKYMARFVEVLIASEPRVWAGERTRHMAHFWLLRGQALAAMGNRDEGRHCLLYALTQNPYPQVEAQIQKALAVIG